RVGKARAVTLTSPVDGRVMFVLPWGDLSYVGTTDTDDVAPPDDVRASGSDVVYLLRSANAFFPQARLAPHDVICSWAGLRPLLAPEREVAASAVPRAHGKPIIPGRPEIWAEVRHAVEREMALRLGDVLMRRLHLFSETRDQAVPATSAVADHLGELLGWDAARRSEEIADYAKQVAQSRAYLKEVARLSKP